MTYISLYRKWRSQVFDEIIGQEPIIQTIKNAVKNNRISHAYLFSGPRGTGKTSTARIFAKALNCEKGPTPDPCGKCDNCIKIKDGHAVDVMEIDAASNRGIDEIRDLREKARYAPVEGKYKVYIIDEVHMLTSEAFNALLKTLEEPPEHVIFILATTEPQKVPLTILSRCQRLDFRRIPYDKIVEQLKKITSKEKYSIEDSALNLIVRNSEGSMRDAISLLDQLISFCEGKITHDDVAIILGTAGADSLFEFGEVIGKADTAKALDMVNKFILEGKSVPQVTKDILNHFRHILLAKLGSDEVIEETTEHVDRLKKQAELFGTDELQKMIGMISKAETDMRWHPQSRLVLEVVTIEICSLKADEPVEKAVTVEKKVSPERSPFSKIKEALNKVQEVSKPEKKAPIKVSPEESKPSKAAASGGGLLDKVKQNWPEVLDLVKGKSINGYISLHEGVPVDASDGKLVIGFKKGFAFHKLRLEEDANKAVVEEALEKVVSENLKISCVIKENDAASTENKRISVKDLTDIFGGRVMKKS
ncbi:DNA polymerase III subunit gamma/tau [Candidatus Margulisiibacteriota bacterium]